MKIFNTLQKQLSAIQVPGLDLTLGDLNAVEAAERNEISLSFGFPAESLKEELIETIRAKLNKPDIKISIKQNIVSHAVQQGLKGLPDVKNIIAVA